MELIIALYTFLAWAGVGTMAAAIGLLIILIVYLVRTDVPDPKG